MLVGILYRTLQARKHKENIHSFVELMAAEAAIVAAQTKATRVGSWSCWGRVGLVFGWVDLGLVWVSRGSSPALLLDVPLGAVGCRWWFV